MGVLLIRGIAFSSIGFGFLLTVAVLRGVRRRRTANWTRARGSVVALQPGGEGLSIVVEYADPRGYRHRWINPVSTMPLNARVGDSVDPRIDPQNYARVQIAAGPQSLHVGQLVFGILGSVFTLIGLGLGVAGWITGV